VDDRFFSKDLLHAGLYLSEKTGHFTIFAQIKIGE